MSLISWRNISYIASGFHIISVQTMEKPSHHTRWNSSSLKWNYSTGYYPQANGVAEAFNKTLGKILKKIFSKYRRDWHDRLSEALWAYRVTVRTPTQATPYSIIFGSEAILPLEIQVPSLQVALHEELPHDEQIQLQFQELDVLEEGCLQAIQNLELYRRNMVRP